MTRWMEAPFIKAEMLQEWTGKMLSSGLGTKTPGMGTYSREDQEATREGHSQKRQSQV